MVVNGTSWIIMGCIYIYTCIYTYIYIYYTHVYIYIYTCIYIYVGFCLPITDLEIIGHCLCIYIYMCVCGNYLIFED